MRAPRRDDRRLDDPKYRPELYSYSVSGAVELRSPAGWLYTTDHVDLSEWR